MKTKIIFTGGNLFTELNRIENREEKLAEINSMMLTPGGSIFRSVIIKGNSDGTHAVSTAMVFLPLVVAPVGVGVVPDGIIAETEVKVEKKKHKTEK